MCNQKGKSKHTFTYAAVHYVWMYPAQTCMRTLRKKSKKAPSIYNIYTRKRTEERNKGGEKKHAPEKTQINNEIEKNVSPFFLDHNARRSGPNNL